MKIFARIFWLLVAMPTLYVFIYWIIPEWLLPDIRGLDEWAVRSMISLPCVIIAGGFVLFKMGSENKGLISSILYGAVLSCGIGRSTWIFGGPLTGLLLGMWGFFLGGAGGLILWCKRYHEQKIVRKELVP
jgi:hypothetical protein